MGLCFCTEMADGESDIADLHRLGCGMSVVRNRMRAKRLPVIWMRGAGAMAPIAPIAPIAAIAAIAVDVSERFGYAHVLVGQEGRDANRSPRKPKFVVNLIKDAFIKAGDCNGYLVNGFPQTMKQANLFVKEIAPVDCIVVLENAKDNRVGDGNLTADSDEFLSAKFEDVILKINADADPSHVLMDIEAAILNKLSSDD